jgi:hypothetical protein
MPAWWGNYELVDELFPMWGQFDESPDGDVDGDSPDAGGFGAPPGGPVSEEPLEAAVVDDPPEAVPAAGVETDVVGVVLPVAALATAAPPPTSAPVTATPASVCRMRIFMCFHLPPRRSLFVLPTDDGKSFLRSDLDGPDPGFRVR